MARNENKYLVPNKWKDDLRNDMIIHLNHDFYSELRPAKEYTVRSIYLDSPGLTSYYEKLAGVKIRNKFRVRGYNELTLNSKIFAEIKRKNDSFVSKDRAPIYYNELNNFLDFSDISKIENHSIEYGKRLKSAGNFLYYLKRDKLKPVINVIYEREAFECKFGSGLRVTFDMNIRSFLTHSFNDLFENKNMKTLYTSSFVLEIKYNKVLPSWVSGIIYKYNLNKESISKYALSTERYLRDNLMIYSL